MIKRIYVEKDNKFLSQLLNATPIGQLAKVASGAAEELGLTEPEEELKTSKKKGEEPKKSIIDKEAIEILLVKIKDKENYKPVVEWIENKYKIKVDKISKEVIKLAEKSKLKEVLKRLPKEIVKELRNVKKAKSDSEGGNK